MFRPYASIGTNLLFFEKGDPTRDIWFYEHLVPVGQRAYSMTKPIRVEHLQDCIDWWGGAQRKGRQETDHAWTVTAEDVKAKGYNLDVRNPHAPEHDQGDPEELLAKLAASESDAGNLRDQLKTIPDGSADRMTRERLLTHFDHIADDPGAVPRVRRFIVDLAVRGRLVPQDPTEGDGAALLHEIERAWAARRLNGQRKPRKAKRWGGPGVL